MSEENQEVSIADELLAEAEQAEREEVQQAETKENNEQKGKIEQAKMLAYAGVQSAAAFAEKKWSCLSFDDKTKIEVGDKAAAVLAKYDLQMPPWLAAFKEEIELGLVLGTVIFSSYTKIQAWKKEQEKKQEDEERGGQP